VPGVFSGGESLSTGIACSYELFYGRLCAPRGFIAPLPQNNHDLGVQQYPFTIYGVGYPPQMPGNAAVVHPFRAIWLKPLPWCRG